MRDEGLMPFGKYQGETIESIADDDPEYLQWLLDNMDDMSNSLRDKIENALSNGYP